MGGVTSDLVTETLGSNDSDLCDALAFPRSPASTWHPHLIADPLVGLEVERELGVVTLNDDLGGLLDGLCADATHFGDCVWIYGESVEEEGCWG